MYENVLHFRDGIHQQLGGRLRDFHNKPYPIRAKIEYYNKVLTVRMFDSVIHRIKWA